MSATISDEQLAARELVRGWAAGSGAIAAVRDSEGGSAQAWQPVYRGLVDLGLFGVAVAEEAGGAGGSVSDLCVMVEEAARALVPGPGATTALAIANLGFVHLSAQDNGPALSHLARARALFDRLGPLVNRVLYRV
ncbi:MAG TPA: acyl-CoA dehydrogenase family protein, partial [Mycobacterium sp.]|nr:acyl-CoA dehydrogenase family protein [Mycobacterium sp.]